MNALNLISNVFSILTLFEMFFLQPVLGGHPVLSCHLAILQGDHLIQVQQYFFYIQVMLIHDEPIFVKELHNLIVNA